VAASRLLRHVDEVRRATTFAPCLTAFIMLLAGCTAAEPAPKAPVASTVDPRDERALQRDREEQQAEERRRREAEAKLDAREAREDQDWATAVPQRCEDPIDPWACEPLDAFLAKWPAGRHASRALAVRKRGAALIEARRDDYAWAAALPQACLLPRASTGCAGIDRYLASFPEGPHADEARRIRAVSVKAIERLRREEKAADKGRAAARVAAEEEDEKGSLTIRTAAEPGGSTGGGGSAR